MAANVASLKLRTLLDNVSNLKSNREYFVFLYRILHPLQRLVIHKCEPLGDIWFEEANQIKLQLQTRKRRDVN